MSCTTDIFWQTPGLNGVPGYIHWYFQSLTACYSPKLSFLNEQSGLKNKTKNPTLIRPVFHWLILFQLPNCISVHCKHQRLTNPLHILCCIVVYWLSCSLQSVVGWLLFFTYSVWSVVSTVGYSCSAFAEALRLLARLVVWYHPKVSDAFGCCTRVACLVVALCLAFCFMHRLVAIFIGLRLFL